MIIPRRKTLRTPISKDELSALMLTGKRFTLDYWGAPTGRAQDASGVAQGVNAKQVIYTVVHPEASDSACKVVGVTYTRVSSGIEAVFEIEARHDDWEGYRHDVWTNRYRIVFRLDPATVEVLVPSEWGS